MSRVVLSPAALRDLEDIWLYIAQDGPKNADRIVDQLLAICRDTLAPTPAIGRMRDELEVGLRSFPAQNHLVFYRPIENGVAIVRVVHGRRDLLALFSSNAIKDAGT